MTGQIHVAARHSIKSSSPVISLVLVGSNSVLEHSSVDYLFSGSKTLTARLRYLKHRHVKSGQKFYMEATTTRQFTAYWTHSSRLGCRTQWAWLAGQRATLLGRVCGEARVCVCDNNSVKLSVYLYVCVCVSVGHGVNLCCACGKNAGAWGWELCNGVRSLRPRACSALLGDNWSLQERAGHCARGIWLVYGVHWQEFGLVVWTGGVRCSVQTSDSSTSDPFDPPHPPSTIEMTNSLFLWPRPVDLGWVSIQVFWWVRHISSLRFSAHWACLFSSASCIWQHIPEFLDWHCYHVTKIFQAVPNKRCWI